jgi:hypothetical protein
MIDWLANPALSFIGKTQHIVLFQRLLNMLYNLPCGIDKGFMYTIVMHTTQHNLPMPIPKDPVVSHMHAPTQLNDEGHLEE